MRSGAAFAALLAILCCCGTVTPGNEPGQSDSRPGFDGLMDLAGRYRTEGRPAEAMQCYLEAAAQTPAGSDSRMSAGLSAASLDGAPRSPSLARLVMTCSDSAAPFTALQVGGFGICPDLAAALGDGALPLGGYLSLMLADTLLAHGDCAGALEAIRLGAGDTLCATAEADRLVLLYSSLLGTGDLDSATALRQASLRDSVTNSRMLGALGLWRRSRGAAGWQDALIQSIRLWPAGYIHARAWEALRSDLLADSALASQAAASLYEGGLWNELYDIAVNSPNPPAQAVYMAGRTRDRLGFYSEACGLLDLYLRRWPSGPDAEAALTNLALDAGRMGLVDSSLALFDRLESAYPASPRLGNLPWYRGSILAESGHWDSAMDQFRISVRDFPANVTADDSHFYLCLGLLRAGRASDARAELVAFIDRWGSSVYRPSARYLLGRLLLEEANDPAGADSLRRLISDTPDCLPARFARQVLGLPQPQLDARSGFLEEWMATVGAAFAEPSPSARRGEVLFRAGLREWATGEFKEAEQEVGGGGRLAWLYLRDGVWERMPNAGWRMAALGSGSLPTEVWELRYPAAWPELVTGTSGRFGFDPVLVWAIMRQESMFQPRCSSPAGARGLIQMIPSTSEYVALENGWDDYSPDLLFQPEVSLRYGVSYLASTAGGAGGVLQTLASYNGGPHNAQGRWGASSLADDLFFCRITFNETREYVEKVYNNYQAYRQLYPGYAAMCLPAFTAPLSLSESVLGGR